MTINEIEFDLTGSPVGEPKQKTLANGDVLIGYVEHDPDVGNPCEEMDGEGTVRSFSRKHINQIDPDEAVSILKKDKMAVALSYFEHGQGTWMIQGENQGYPDWRWDGVTFAGV